MTTEQEMVTIVETLIEFCINILGHHITVYTYHNNIAYDNFTTERVLYFCPILEEYVSAIKYIKRPGNDKSDALSTLLRM